MSVLEAYSKQAPSSYDPLHLAMEAEAEILRLRSKIELQASLARQLMVGRIVRQIETGRVFQVREIRVVNGRIVLRGRRHSRSSGPIGSLASVEIVKTGDGPSVRIEEKP